MRIFQRLTHWPALCTAFIPRVTLFLVLVCGGCTAPRYPASVLEAPAAIRLHEAHGICIRETDITGQQEPRELEGDEITILSWNMAKGSRPGWHDDLHRLSAGKDLVLLQEALLSTAVEAALDLAGHDFSPGYRTERYTSGIWTASSASTLSACPLESREPLLATPKMVLVTEYSLRDRDDTLLVANIHAVNFALGLGAFRRQLQETAALLQNHDGPILFAGDFNTWSRSRARELERIVEELSLEQLKYTRDYRRRVFGKVLDHVFYRGMKPVASQSEWVRSSDHSPITAVLQFAPVSATGSR